MLIRFHHRVKETSPKRIEELSKQNSKHRQPIPTSNYYAYHNLPHPNGVMNW